MAVEQVDFKQDEVDTESNNIVGFSDKIGKMLTKARRERELSIGQIAKVLNIRAEYLSAFEKNDYTNMPSSSYAQGFLKSYAAYLDLDGEAMVTELKNTGYLQSSVKHHIPQPIETNIVPSRTIILGTLGVLALLLAVWGLYALQPEEKIIPAPVTKYAPKQVVKVTEKAKIVVPDVKQKAPVIIQETKPVIEKITTVVQQEQTLAPASLGRIRLVINSEVWMQLRAPSGKVYMNKTFNAGDEYLLATPENTVLDIGKPSAVSLYVDGQDKTPWKKSNRRVIKGMSTDIPTIIQMNKDLIN
jgi:transcriptional regulator with XRE-family HTH domain